MQINSPKKPAAISLAQLVLHFITSIGKLNRLYKTVEEAQIKSEKFRSPSSNVPEPNLAYQKIQSTFKLDAIGSEFSPVVSTSNQSTWVETISPISCWNCSQTDHQASQCSEPKRLHCLSGGTSNVTIHLS